MLFDYQAWIVLPVVLPIAASLLCFLFGRYSTLIAIFTAIVNNLVVGVLVRQLLIYGAQRYVIGGWYAPLGINLQLDGPAVLMVLMTAVTGVGITVYAKGYFSCKSDNQDDNDDYMRQKHYFWPLWMMLWAALNGMFLSADIFNIYVTLELVGISAVPLAALSGRHASQLAAFRYILVNLLGSLCFLLGIVFLYKTYAVLDLELLAQFISPEPGVQAALALITVGLLFKTALFPLHFWLPPAHANAPAPVSAILSGLVIKGSFYLLFRLWFEIFTPAITDKALTLLGILGACAIFWGAVQAIRQQRLKLLVAYSTVSQLGYLFIAFPLANMEQGAEIWSVVIFMAMAHACAKAAMFMATGTILLHAGHDRIDHLAGIRAYLPITSFAYAVAGVNLIGLPPSGGFIAKWLLLSSSFASAQWWWGIIVITGSFLASIYVYRVVSKLFIIPENTIEISSQPCSSLLEWPALALALISLFLGLATPYPLQLLNVDNMIAAWWPMGGLP
jgi:formate hydrogenlyase subunit 3/multisubunit Na+/H+ antiporter MnhD subunit